MKKKARPRNPVLAFHLARLGMTNCRLAEVTKLHRCTLSLILNLRRDPKTKTAQRIAAALGCKPKDIWPELFGPGGVL